MREGPHSTDDINEEVGLVAELMAEARTGPRRKRLKVLIEAHGIDAVTRHYLETGALPTQAELVLLMRSPSAALEYIRPPRRRSAGRA